VFGRSVTRDVALYVRKIPKGAIVGLAFGGGSYDENGFECLREFKLDRSPNRHSAFGAGSRLCAGAGVAGMELEVTFEALIKLNDHLHLVADENVVWKVRGDRRGLSCLPLSITK
jgi:cytochrome P450